MDPFSQGFLGAAAAQSVAHKKEQVWVFLLGFFAGALADVDVAIKIPGDEIGSFLLHRHFTHGLFFIPIGAAVAALLYWLMVRRKYPFKRIFLFAFVGYATHGVLDAATSYGTVLLWPLSNERIAWDFLPIIHAAVTFPLAIGCIYSLWKKKLWPVRVGLVWFLVFAGFSFYQSQRVVAAHDEVVAAREHTPENRRLMPRLGTVADWRVVYRHNGQIYADRAQTPLFKAASIEEGGAVPVINGVEDIVPTPTERQRYDFERYNWFADGFLAKTGNGMIGDMRYTSDPKGFEPLWGLKLEEGNFVRVRAAFKSN